MDPESKSLRIKFPIRFTWTPHILCGHLMNSYSFTHKRYICIDDGVGTLEMGSTSQSTNAQSMANDSSNGRETPFDSSNSKDTKEKKNLILDTRSNKRKWVRIADLTLMVVFGIFYGFAIIGCFTIPIFESRKSNTIGISMWK